MCTLLTCNQIPVTQYHITSDFPLFNVLNDTSREDEFSIQNHIKTKMYNIHVDNLIRDTDDHEAIEVSPA